MNEKKEKGKTYKIFKSSEKIMIIISIMMLLIGGNTLVLQTMRPSFSDEISGGFPYTKSFTYFGGFEEKINGTENSFEITIMEIPSINVSVKVTNNPISDKRRVIYMKMFNPERLVNETSQKYYYRTKHDRIYIESDLALPTEKIPEPLFLIMNPYDFERIYFSEINKTITLLSDVNNVSKGKINRLFGEFSFYTLVFSNNSYVFPFFGPEEASFYMTMINRQKSLLNELKSFQSIVDGLFLTTETNEEIKLDDENNQRIDILSMNYTISIVLTNEDFNLEFDSFVYGGCMGKFANSLDLNITTHVKYDDFKLNSSMEFRKTWGFYFDLDIPMPAKTTEEPASMINVFEVFVVLILNPITLRMVKNNERQVRDR